jgi:hypothetical protein
MFIHNELYKFWLPSIGVWDSHFLTLTVKWLDEEELLLIGKIHHLYQAEFGVKMSWEYKKKSDSGHMSWCVDAARPNLVFTNKSLAPESSPRIFNYQLLAANKLVMSVGKYEETVMLESDRRRLREQRYDGKLIRRLWEEKVRAEIPQRLISLAK